MIKNFELIIKGAKRVSPQLNDELKDQIKKGVSLDKVDEEDLKKREEEKKKRQEELDKVKAALGKES